MTQSGAAQQVVTGLVGDISATALSGTLTVTTGDNTTDNDISITTGSANTTITASGKGDTITVNADALADNKTLDVNGSATYTVSNLEANSDAAGTSGTVSLAYTDVTDNAATITIGSGATTVSGTTSGDTLTINANNLANDTTLTQSGSAQQVVTSLKGDISATALTGTLTVTTGNASDDAINITTGTANTTITASGSGDTITVNADALADNTTLDINGSSTFTVSNIEANTDAAGTSGTVSLAYTDVTDNAASITTGSGATTVSATTSADTLTTNANNLANDTTLTQSGAAQQVVTGLVGDISATALSGTLTVTTGDNSTDNDISITTGSANTTITASGSGDTITVNADALADNTTLDINGSATFTVTNLEANTDAAGSSGTVNLAYGDIADNAATISTGSGATTVSGSSSDDTLTTNAGSLPQNTLLTLFGAARQVVTNLIGNITGTSLNGSLDVTTGDAADNGISITTGTANTTITASGTSDTITIDADALADDTSLDINGSATYTVSNLEANTNAVDTTGTVSLTFSDITDNEATVTIGTANTTLTASGSGDTITVNADAQADNKTLDINGSSTFTVNNLEANTDASGTSGTVSLAYTAVTDNAATISTGSGATTVSGSSSDDTLTINASSLANNTTLTESGTAKQVVTGLVGDISATALTGTLTVTTGNNTSDNGISITTGTADTTITASGSGDTITVNADQMADNTTLDINGSANYALTNLEANTDAAGSSGALNITYSNIGDEAASLLSGIGNVVVSGGDSSNTITVTGLSTNSQTFNAQASTSNFNITAGANNQTITGSNTGNDTIEGGDGTDTLSYAGGSNVDVTINSYSTQSGGSTGQGTDTFTGIESLVGATGTDTLRGSTANPDEVATVSGANSGTIRDSASSGSFSFSSFEQLDLQGGNDTVLFDNNSASLAANLDLGAGTADTLSYAGYSNAVSVTLTDITSNTGSTAAGGATAITGTATGFEILVGGSSSVDTLTDSTGASKVAITAANSGTIDGLAFSSIENLSLSTGDDTVTVTGNGSGVSLTGSLDLGDGTNSLTMSSSAGSIASVTSGTGVDTFSISSGSVTGAVSAGDGSNTLEITSTSSSIGSYVGGSGTDSITLSGGDVKGAVSTGDGNDTVLISSTDSAIGGNLDLAGGTGDTLSYAGYSDAVSVTLTGITSSAGSTAAAGATAISGTSAGFENLIGGSNSGDTITDSTGNSTIVISGANSGTIDGMTFSAIENLSLSTGIDGVTVSTGGSLSGNLNLGDGTSNTLTIDSGAGAIGSVSAAGGNDTVTINGGTVTGAVNLGDGANALTINNTVSTIGSYTGGSGIDTIDSKGGVILGAVSTGGAADSVTLSLGASIAGAVTLGTDVSQDGADTLTVTGTDSKSKSVISGSIATGAGADIVTMTDATIGGAGQTLSLGSDSSSFDGDDKLTASGTEITATFTTGSGSDTVILSAASVVTGDVTLGSATDTTNGSIDTLTLNASTITGNVNTGSGADAVNVLTTSTITGNVTLGTDVSQDGADSLTVTGTSSASKSVITGSIGTGAGADTVTLTDATIGGVGQTLSLGSDSSSFDGDDKLTASGTEITATFTTGSGSDTVILSAASVVTGDVTLGSATDTTNGSTDTVTLNASSITGNVSTGSGADAVNVLTTSTITGNVTLGTDVSQDGADTLTVTGTDSESKSVISGSIYTGGGADLVTFIDATIGGEGKTLNLGDNGDSNDGNDSLSGTRSKITANTFTGAGADEITLTDSTLSGIVDMGGGNDSLTLTAGSTITGMVTFGEGDDLLNLGNGISSSATITGEVDLGNGSNDILSYQGNVGPIVVALNDILEDGIGTAANAYATYVTSEVGGFEAIIGSDYVQPTSEDGNGDVILDNTGASLVILTGDNSGTIDQVDFSSIENLQLRSENDTLKFEGTGFIYGRADGGGLTGAEYAVGINTGGGVYEDKGLDLLDYTSYKTGPVTVDLSQNLATGVYGGLAGGLIDGDAGLINVSTDNSSFENVDGSQDGDLITGDNQELQGNVLRGFGGNDTILGLAGNDTIDGGDGTSGADGNDLIVAGDGADLIIGSDGDDFISGGGYFDEGGYFAVSDQSVDTLTYIDENEGLDISLNGTDAGTVSADADSSAQLTKARLVDNYSAGKSYSTPTNPTVTDWTDTYGDIQRLVLTNQSDILRLDSTDYISSTEPIGPDDIGGGTFSVDAAGGSFDTLDYSSFASNEVVVVNLSGNTFNFDFDANGEIDATKGEIAIESMYSATNINVSTGLDGIIIQSNSQTEATETVPLESSMAQAGGNYGVNNFEVVIGGSADDAIVGNDAANILFGNAGSDRIAGLAGDDTIYGGEGDDYLIGGDGKDTIYSGGGINYIVATSQDFADGDQARWFTDSGGINRLILNGNGSTDTGTITAPEGDWNPGTSFDVVEGGDPFTDSVTKVTTYDSIEGSAKADNYQFDAVALKNISDVNMGDGDDTVSTAPVVKGTKVNYDGGDDTDSIVLTFTFQQLARLNQSNAFVSDVQQYLDNPGGSNFSSNQADFTASNFENASIGAVTPARFNEIQADPAALTYNSSIALKGVTTTSGGDLGLSANARTTSTATASSTYDLSSALVLANNVKGADAVTVIAGGNLTGSSTAEQLASASAITVDDRSDAVLSAYALGADRSSMVAGADVTMSLSGTVKADTIAQAGNSVVNASGTAEAAGSRDSSLSAADALSATISGTNTQTVTATNIDGLAIAGLASRTYGIDDPNLDGSADSLQAGSDLGLNVNAVSNSRVTAASVGTASLGLITLDDRGVAGSDRFITPLRDAAFPLILGDRIQFASTPGGSSLEANRDYFVINVLANLGEFQLSSTLGGDPLDVVGGVGGDDGIVLEAFRPAVSTADAISTITGVDLNRNGVGLAGVQAGDSLTLNATANDSVRSTATSVSGDATAGINRLGGLDNLDVLPVSTVVALSDTTTNSGADAKVSSVAGESGYLQATSTAGDALSEGNVQVLGSDTSSITAGADLTTLSSASLSLIADATSTSGRADSRSGSGAGAGSSTGGIGNAVPDASTYGLVSAVTDSSQSAGADLSLQANATSELTASSKTVGGSTTLSSLWSLNNVLSTFDPAATTPSLIGPQYLVDGQEVQLDAANRTSLGLLADTDYVVRLLATTGVNDATNTLTMPTGITYSNGDAIRFRLNSTTVSNATASRYGLELGTTYYVINASGSDFQLSTAPGGSLIDLTADSSGLDDQLVDSDRFQLLEPPALPGAAYTVATLTPVAGGGLSVILPSESTAFAGSRQAGITLADPSALNLAQLNAVDGSGLAAGSGLMSLLSGAASTITAFADGVLNALSRNVGSDATASAGLLAEGIRDTAITAGSDGTVNTRATINAVAEASTTGDNALLDNSLANLNVSATGLSSTAANQDITIGGAGDVQSTASLSGRSTASTVLGDSDALAALQATGLEALSNGFTATIGQQGDISAAASIGSLAAPLLISALSSAEGDATAQAAAAAVGILGSYDATVPAGFSSLQAGTSQGDISGTASADLALSAIATNGIASVTLADVPGTGRASITGIENMALTAGAGLSSVDATAVGRANLSARSVELDASSAGSTSSTGVFSSTVAALPISFADDGRIAAIAQQSSFAQSVTVNGNASTSLNNTSLGIGNATITIAGDGNLNARAISQLDSRSQSVAGDASA